MLVTHFAPYLDGAITAGLAGTALVISATFAGWITARWMLGGLELEHVHPGYLLPTVAASLVSAVCFSTLNAPDIAYALAGIGLLFWVVIAGLNMTRGFAWHDHLGALTPTLAILAAPAPVAGILWFSLGEPGGTHVGAAIFGLTCFGILTQAFLMPTYARLTFTPSFWSFTFTSAAIATFTVQWVALNQLPAVLAWLPVAMVAILIVAIAVRHLLDPLFVAQRADDPSTARRR